MCVCLLFLTDTGTTETDGSGTHANVLGDLDKGVGHLRGVSTLGLGGDLSAGRVHEGRGALHGVEGSGLAGSSYIAYVNEAPRRTLLALDGMDMFLPPEYARAKF